MLALVTMVYGASGLFLRIAVTGLAAHALVDTNVKFGIA